MSYEYDDVDDGANNLLWGRLAALGVFAVLIFSLGYCAAPNGVPEDELAVRDATIVELRQDNDQLRGVIESRPSEPATTTAEGTETPGTSGGNDGASGNGTTYEVVAGDTLSIIAGKVYDDPSKFPLIVEANGLDANAPINVGDELTIPPDPDAASGSESADAGPSEDG